jgi:hypothetical protein
MVEIAKIEAGAVGKRRQTERTGSTTVTPEN